MQRAPTIIVVAALLALAASAPAWADANADMLLAAYQGDRARVVALLLRGARLDARDENGYTALHWAAFRGDQLLARTLLDRGAGVDLADKRGQTPLILAAWNDHPATVRLLLERGADPAHRSAEGFQAIDYARTRGHQTVMKLLAPLALVTRPTTRPTPRPTAALPTPEPTPESFEESPAPTPTPKPTARAPGANDVALVGGAHLSHISFPIVGVHYRRTLTDWLAARLGFEAGGYQQPVGTGAVSFNFMRFHGSLTSAGWLYGGVGATYIVLGSVYSSGYNPSVISYEAIGGVRVPVGPVWLNAEGRFGIAGPSTALLGFSGAF
ncbi:MAG: ripk4 [Cyanobacteria bacterium RYN_339]|nr:ripk4 [Cyanobacteria bacterium RYN_339]